MKTILLVDDVAMVRKLARHTLQGHDYRILEAEDGFRALRLAREEKPDLILLDYYMPGCDGLEVCRRLKSSPDTRDIRIILLTGVLGERDRKLGLQAGADGFFTKPFSPLALLAKVKTLLEGEPVPEIPEAAAPAADLEGLEHEQLLLYARDLGRVFWEEAEKTRQLQSAFARLQETERMKDVFVSLVSHEVRTPLSIIKGYAALLERTLRAAGSAEKLLGFLEGIGEAADRLNSLFQELLEYSRLRSGHLVPHRRDVEMAALFRLLRQRAKGASEIRGQRFEMEVPEDLGTCRADPERLREAVWHLVRNAITFTPPGGTVRVEASGHPERVEIRVTDSGPGIPREEQERIFIPFYQVGDINVREVEGVGLGLTIARRIVEDHGGTIQVESRPGEGTTFTVILPRAGPPERPAAVPEEVPVEAPRLPERPTPELLEQARGLAEELARERVRVRQLEEMILELERAYCETVAALARWVDSRDAYGMDHSERVAFYSTAIARRLDPELLKEKDFLYALLLHDIGKIGIAESVLQKAERLTDGELQQVQSHPEIAAEIASHIQFLSPAIASIRSHHERWDGKGYPQGLRGEEIPLPARVIAVADAFEAMTRNRPYRPGITPAEARDEITRQAGRQFDPRVVEAFLEAWDEISTYLQTQEAPAER